ncbi:MAG: hypothetical protein P8I83_10055 [Paracoccaceae bacterium]|nr:hypothetical protein [Paracoccaceae bacterium]
MDLDTKNAQVSLPEDRNHASDDVTLKQGVATLDKEITMPKRKSDELISGTALDLNHYPL